MRKKQEIEKEGQKRMIGEDVPIGFFSVRDVGCEGQDKMWTECVGWFPSPSPRRAETTGNESYPLTIGMEGAAEVETELGKGSPVVAREVYFFCCCVREWSLKDAV